MPMYRLLIALFLFSTSLNAQIQFWSKDDIIEKQMESACKAMQIKTAYNFITNEHWQIDDSTRYNEVTHYNENGQKVVYMKFKTDWVKKKRYYQMIDSVWYTDKGIFKELRRYTPKGERYVWTYRALATHNKKGNIEQLNIYGGYQMEELKKYDVYSYDKNNNVSKIESYNAATKEKEYERSFEYDNRGNLTSYSATSIFGDMRTTTVSKITYNKNGQLSTYTEYLDGKEKQNEATYTYDTKGRYIKRVYSTTYNYEDTFECFYDGDATVPYRTYLKYPRGRGSNEFANEFLAYIFDYFE